jgi:hypothetical protein
MIDMLRFLADAHRRTPEAPSPSPSLFDFIRLHAMIHEESKRLHDMLFERLVDAWGLGANEPSAGQAETLPDEVSIALRRVQLLLLKHPIAAQAAFAALVAEGRRFSRTPEGAEWAEALAGSDLVRKGRRVWDAVAMNMLEEDPDTIIPSAYLEALLSAARSADLEGLLGRLSKMPNGGGEHAEAP